MGFINRLAATADRGANAVRSLLGRNGRAGPGPGVLRGPDGQPVPADSPAVPHVYTFAQLLNVAAKTYSSRWDEAYKRSREDALAMRRDASITAMLFDRYMPTGQMAWHVEPDDPDDATQQEAGEYFGKALEAVPDLDQLKYSLIEAAWYGRAGAQLGWGADDEGPDNLYTVRKHWPVNGDKIQHSWDGEPSVMIYPSAAQDLRDQGADVRHSDAGAPLLVLNTPAWRQRFAINRAWVVDADFWQGEEAGQVGGVGLRHWCYWYWWLGHSEIQSWALDFFERTGLGLTVWYYDEGNPKSLEAVAAAAKEQQRNTNILCPRSGTAQGVGTGLERIETNAAGGVALIKEVVQGYYDAAIERLITGQTHAGDSKGRSLGGDESGLSEDSHSRIVRHDCARLAACLTQDVLRPMVRFNRPDALPYRLKVVFDIDRPDAQGVLEAVKTFVEMGGTVIESEVRALAGGLSEPKDGDKVLGGAAMLGTGPGGNGKPPGRRPDRPQPNARDGNPALYYDPDEPRVPAGRKGGGRWTKGGAAAGDPAAHRPSKPGERHDVDPPKQTFRPPPPPKGKAGERKAGGFTATGRTNTEVGDHVEALTEKLGLRSILPEGQRHGKSIEKEGSTLDREYDHSGWAFEVKAVTTSATEYKAKPKAHEAEGKRRYAEIHGLKPATMIAVIDYEAGEVHCYWREGIGAFRLKADEDGSAWNYLGTVAFRGEP